MPWACGGTGIRVRLKSVWAQAHVGSTPTMPTTQKGPAPADRNLLCLVYTYYMPFAAVYCVQQFVYRIFSFFRHWYAGGFRKAAHWTLLILERLDRVLALKVTIRYFFRPLYQDYSFAGYFFGFPFRVVRALAALVVYAFVIAMAIALYLAWAFAPLYVLYWGFGM